jgi:nitrous oxide reductase accessory protein NosL
MKKGFIFSLMVFVLAGFSIVFAQDDIAKHPACPFCGMDRAKFAHSRVFIEYDDESTAGFCSIHCAAIDMMVNIDKAPQAVMVGDFNTKKLVDSEKAVWVIGGKKMGVMTKRAKWAFADETTAQSFIAQNGGNLAAFEEAIKATFEDMYQDTKMIREKRKMMREKKMKKE